MKCSICNIEKSLVDKRGLERTPRGWKQFAKSIYCGGCWKNHFKIRSLVLAVSSPMDLRWDEFRERLDAAWVMTTQLANSAVTELALQEPAREPGMTRMPKAPNPYLYPWARAQFPELEPQSVVATLHTVQATYNKFRLDVFWRRSRSLPQFRYPTPLPIPGQSVGLKWLSDTEKVPVLSFRLGGERIRLKLTAKHQTNFKRALGMLISGDAKLCEAAIYRKVSHGTHRQGMTTRKAGGGQRIQSQILVKLAGWFPIESNTEPDATHTLELRTENDSFVSASISGSDRWVLRADHVKRWIVSYTDRLQRLSDDQKYERQSRKRRLPIDEYRAKLAEKHHRRLSSFLAQSCADILGYAERNGCRELRWTRENCDFLPSFPWFQFEALLERGAGERGIEFQRATPDQGKSGTKRKAQLK